MNHSRHTPPRSLNIPLVIIYFWLFYVLNILWIYPLFLFTAIATFKPSLFLTRILTGVHTSLCFQLIIYASARVTFLECKCDHVILMLVIPSLVITYDKAKTFNTVWPLSLFQPHLSSLCCTLFCSHVGWLRTLQMTLSLSLHIIFWTVFPLFFIQHISWHALRLSSSTVSFRRLLWTP